MAASSTAEARRRVLNRLRRAHGQLAALIEAVEQGRPCREVVTQLSAVAGALDKAGFAIISSAMRDCLAQPERAEGHNEQVAQGVTNGGGSVPDEPERLDAEELEKLFLMLA